MKLLFASLVCLWLAAGCQQAVAPRLSLGSVTPDFLLVTVGVLGLFSSRRGATVIGFVAGVLQGAVSGATLAGYAVSRTLGGFLVGWFNEMELEKGSVMALITTAFLTLGAQIMLMFLAPPSASAFFGMLAATIGAAVYNGVLAVPFYLLLRPVLATER